MGWMELGDPLLQEQELLVGTGAGQAAVGERKTRMNLIQLRGEGLGIVDTQPERKAIAQDENVGRCGICRREGRPEAIRANGVIG